MRIPPMGRRPRPGMAAIAIITAMLLSCGYDETCELQVSDIDYAGSHRLYFSLEWASSYGTNRYKELCAIYDPASPPASGSPALSISGIPTWRGSYWLLVAEDRDDDGKLGGADRILPGMRIILGEDLVTVIDSIVFGLEESASLPVMLSASMNYEISVFMERPLDPLANEMVYALIGSGADLSEGSALVSRKIAIPDSRLLAGLSFSIATTETPYIVVYMDADASGGLSAGDWISADPAAAPLLSVVDSIGEPFKLSSLDLYQP